MDVVILLPEASSPVTSIAAPVYVRKHLRINHFKFPAMFPTLDVVIWLQTLLL
jgi:hypothetical protein